MIFAIRLCQDSGRRGADAPLLMRPIPRRRHLPPRRSRSAARQACLRCVSAAGPSGPHGRLRRTTHRHPPRKPTRSCGWMKTGSEPRRWQPMPGASGGRHASKALGPPQRRAQEPAPTRLEQPDLTSSGFSVCTPSRLPWRSPYPALARGRTSRLSKQF